MSQSMTLAAYRPPRPKQKLPPHFDHPLGKNRSRPTRLLVRSGPETERRETLTPPAEAPPSPSTAPSKPPPRYTLHNRQNRSWTAVFSDKVIDAVDDIGKHLKRFVHELPTTTALQRITKKGNRLVLEADKPVVLVLGSGWGAHSLLKVIDTDAYEVVCVSPTTSFLFTPMLPSTAVSVGRFSLLCTYHHSACCQ